MNIVNGQLTVKEDKSSQEKAKADLSAKDSNVDYKKLFAELLAQSIKDEEDEQSESNE